MDARTAITAGHRLTIPDDVFRSAGLRDGSRVRVRAQGPGRLVVECDDLMDDCSDAPTAVYGDHYAEGLTTRWRR